MLEILMVDNDIGDAILTKSALSECGIEYNMSIVHDGVEAIDFLKKQGQYESAPRPDIILLDLNMPCMGGHEVLEWIKNDKDLKVIPVVILTTSTNHTDIVKSYEHSANAYLSKPLNLEDYKAAIISTCSFWMKTAKLPSDKD